MEFIPDKQNFIDFLDAPTEFNPLKNDLQNLITDTGQTVGGNNIQFSRASAAYAAQSTFYDDSGTANNYVLSPLSSFKSPLVYARGLKFQFIAANTNDGPSTANLDGKGALAINTLNGNPLTGGEIPAGNYITLIHNGTDLTLLNVSGGVTNDSDNENLIINSDYDFWQRVNPSASTSVSEGGAYYCDRFFDSAGTGGVATVTRKTLTLGTTLPDGGGEPKYAYNRDQTTGGGGDGPIHHQRIERVQTKAGKSIILSIYVRLVAGTLTVTPFIQQNFGTGGSPSAPVDQLGDPVVLSVSPDFVKISARFDLASISGKTLGSNNDDFLACGLLMSTGQVFNVDFSRMSVNENGGEYSKRQLAEELILCQRYYEKTYDTDILPGTAVAAGEVRTMGTKTLNDITTGFYDSSGMNIIKRRIPTVQSYSYFGGTPGVWDDSVNSYTVPVSISAGRHIVTAYNFVSLPTTQVSRGVFGHLTYDAEF